MPLEDEINRSSREISTDGYEMSIGELVSLYKDEELIINPEFQRYFRWEISQKTKFIESILLGIPIPAIFVFQTEDGNWELVDGLQRLSTIFEFIGVLKNSEGQPYPPSILEGTKLLPSLAGMRWEQNGDESPWIGRPQQLEIRRARMRVEIIKKGSDAQSKYELFQRLNTGGSSLSEQEIRTCVMLMVNKEFYYWIRRCSEFEDFKDIILQTETAERKQKTIELALRFFVYRNVPYQGGLDVHEYLDDGMVQLASDDKFDMSEEEDIFRATFRILRQSMGTDAFKRYDGTRFLGQFLLSVYEVVAIGVSKNLTSINSMLEEDQRAFINQRVRDLWGDPTFQRNSGAGVRGTTRLANLLLLGEQFFRP